MRPLWIIGTLALCVFWAAGTPFDDSRSENADKTVLGAIVQLTDFLGELRGNLTQELMSLAADTVALRQQRVAAGLAALAPFDELAADALAQMIGSLKMFNEALDGTSAPPPTDSM